MRLSHKTKTDLAAALALTIALLILAAAPAIIRQAKTYEEPSLFWCKTLRESGSNLSCDWDSDEIPKTALKYWHEGMSPQEATLQAIQDQKENKKEENANGID